MKDYLAKPKPVSPYNSDLVEEYLAQGLTVQSCSHGESGGIPTLLKGMMNPAARKIASSKFNQRRNAA